MCVGNQRCAFGVMLPPVEPAQSQLLCPFFVDESQHVTIDDRRHEAQRWLILECAFKAMWYNLCLQKHLMHDITHSSRKEITQLVPENQVVQILIRPLGKSPSNPNKLSCAKATRLVKSHVCVRRLCAVFMHECKKCIQAGTRGCACLLHYNRTFFGIRHGWRSECREHSSCVFCEPISHFRGRRNDAQARRHAADLATD